MITGEIKSKVDRIWDTLWSGGISNPLTIIEQLTYLLFLKRLDELHTLKENKANRLKQSTLLFFPLLEMVRDAAFQPATPSVRRMCSTTELIALVGRGGCLSRWVGFGKGKSCFDRISGFGNHSG